MKRSFIISYVVTVAFVSAQTWLLAPADNKKTEPTPAPLKLTEALDAPDIKLGPSDNETTVRIPAGRTVSIDLPENATTGYTWDIGEASPDFDAGVRILLDESLPAINAPGRETMVGVPGSFHLMLRAEKPGTYPLSLAYRRSWEKDVAPAQTFKVTLEVFKP